MKMENINVSDIAKNYSLLERFKNMYINKKFDKDLFDIELGISSNHNTLTHGFLQTVFSKNDQMPLNFFVEYNNMWWFPILDKVDVPSISYDHKTQTGAIVLDIYYDQKESKVLRAMQYIKFDNNKITYLRTYCSESLFNDENLKLVLDKFGNDIWLHTGYDLEYSSNAALAFLDSPKGKDLSCSKVTMNIIAEIKRNLNDFKLNIKSRI
jgi:hypothetical protein